MQLVFESATLADAVARAAKMAPNKGAAYDKAQGVGFSVVGDKMRVRSTNLESFFSQVVNILSSSELKDSEIRLPSALAASILTGFPMGDAARTIITLNDDGTVKLSSGKARAKLNQVFGEMPKWDTFDGATLTPVPDLGQRLEQVAWCVDKAITAPLCGVHIDGEKLTACDRIRVVQVPCVVPVDKPITAPLNTLVDLIGSAEEIRLRATERKLLLMPDPETQATTVIYEGQYPDVSRIMRDDFAWEVTFDSQLFIQALTRMLVLVKGERYPTVKFGFGPGTLGIVMMDPDIGRMEDELEVTGGPPETFVIAMTPQHLLQAIVGAKAATVTLRFGPKTLGTVSVTAGDYRADLAVRRAD